MNPGPITKKTEQLQSSDSTTGWGKKLLSSGLFISAVVGFSLSNLGNSTAERFGYWYSDGPSAREIRLRGTINNSLILEYLRRLDVVESKQETDELELKNQKTDNLECSSHYLYGTKGQIDLFQQILSKMSSNHKFKFKTLNETSTGKDKILFEKFKKIEKRVDKNKYNSSDIKEELLLRDLLGIKPPEDSFLKFLEKKSGKK